MTTIQLIGFDEASAPTLSNVLVLDSPDAIDIDNPVVLHVDAAQCFANALAHKDTDADLPFVFLFVPTSHSAPAQTPGYVEETLTGPLADRLREIPVLFRVLRAAQAVPESFFQQLDRPIPTMEPHALPVVPEVQRLLQEHTFARKAFLKALEQRRAAHRMLLSPSVDELAAYVDGLLDTAQVQHIEDYLAHSPASRAEVDLLRRLRKSIGSATLRQPASSTQPAAPVKKPPLSGDGFRSKAGDSSGGA